MRDAAEVYQRAGHTVHLLGTGKEGKGHFGARRAGLHVHVHGDGVVAAAGLDDQAVPAVQALILRGQHAEGARGVAAELAAHHLHVAVAFAGSFTKEAHLLGLPLGHGHELCGKGGAPRLLHGIEHKEGDVAGGIRANDVISHRGFLQKVR